MEGKRAAMFGGFSPSITEEHRSDYSDDLYIVDMAERHSVVSV